MDKLTKLKSCDYKCYPLTSYEQILDFKLSSIEQSLIDEYCIELSARFRINGPKVLLAHDYKGGYQYDAYVFLMNH